MPIHPVAPQGALPQGRSIACSPCRLVAGYLPFTTFRSFSGTSKAEDLIYLTSFGGQQTRRAGIQTQTDASIHLLGRRVEQRSDRPLATLGQISSLFSLASRGGKRSDERNLLTSSAPPTTIALRGWPRGPLPKAAGDYEDLGSPRVVRATRSSRFATNRCIP